jgi:DNA invertase Pin-like site-specific DNA recombinase
MEVPKQMKNGMRVAIYGRVSTSLKQSPEMQLRELRDYCKRRGWQIHDEYIDKGISGVIDSRPELNRLMADAHQRKFSALAVWKFDRFARSVSHLLRALETFRSLGIEFISLSEQVDTSTPAGKLVFTVLGAVAELERSLVGERVRAGLRNAKLNGQKLGRPALKELRLTEIARLRTERRRGASFKQLAENYGVSIWMAFQLCKKKAVKAVTSRV